MAEWTGGERPRRRSQMAELDQRATRRVIADLPDAPGAVQSPQHPGMTPDKSTIPGHGVAVVPKPTLGKRRPLAQYGTAQEIVEIYAASGAGGEWVADDFNGAQSSVEEVRKVNPALTQPERPAPGYETMRALAWLEERSAALEAGVETLSLAAGLPMNAVGVDLAELGAIPTEATLLGMAGAAAGSVTWGDFTSGTWEGGPPVVPASERAGSLTGLGAPAGAVEMAAEALGHTRAADADARPASSTRDAWTQAAPSPDQFSGVAAEVAAAPDAGAGMGIRGGMPLTGEAAAMPLVPEGAVGEEIGRAELGGLPTAAPMPRDVAPGYASGAPVDAADMGGDLQPGFTTGGAAREGGEGGWLAQQEQIEGIVADGSAGRGHRAVAGAPVDAADMGGDLQPGFTTGGAAREGGDGGWLVQEELIEGVVPGAGGGAAAAGAVVLEGWDGPVPEGSILYAGANGACPEEYPIKGNLPSRFYHLPGDFAYRVTVPEFCFNHEHAAYAAGFTRAPQRSEGGHGAGGDAAAGGLHGLRAVAAAGGEPPAPAGSVRAGGKTCPGSHPIKGNLQSGYYHRPQDPSYSVTIPEFCFATEPEAQAAGFTLAGNAKQD